MNGREHPEKWDKYKRNPRDKKGRPYNKKLKVKEVLEELGIPEAPTCMDGTPTSEGWRMIWDKVVGEQE